MSRADKPAFAHGDPERGGDPGMTLREYYAGLAMQGMLAHGDDHSRLTDHYTALSVDAVCYADALIAALEAQHES